MDGFVQQLIRNSDRRIEACKHVTPCPKCGTVQVQITSWLTEDVTWKCRHCKYKWTKFIPWEE